MPATPINDRARDWPLTIFGAVLALTGSTLALGGAMSGDAWYPVLAGAGLIVAGVQVARGRISGAWWFAAVFVGTLAWAVWESGFDYWRWAPRVGLAVVFAFVLSLLLPRLDDAPSRTVARTLAVLFAFLFIVAFALAFVPGVTHMDVARPLEGVTS